eukprot:11447408-Alexandrium_andersonii.AAC.1
MSPASSVAAKEVLGDTCTEYRSNRVSNRTGRTESCKRSLNTLTSFRAFEPGTARKLWGYAFCAVFRADVESDDEAFRQ